jgi:hypothetical protein
MANKVSKYLKNLDKETNQAMSAGETLKIKKGTSKEKAAANKLRNERGQMFGALLQGRRYDKNGKQITKSSSKKPAAPKPAKKRPGAKPAPLGRPPARPKRGTPAPLGTPPAKPTGRRPAPRPKTTRKSPGKNVIPPDYDVILPGMGYTKPTKKNPPKRIKKK